MTAPTSAPPRSVVGVRDARRARQRSASNSASLNGFVRPFFFARTRAMSATVTGVARFPQFVLM